MENIENELFRELLEAARNEPYLKNCKAKYLAEKLVVCLVKDHACSNYYNFADLKLCRHKLGAQIVIRTSFETQQM